MQLCSEVTRREPNGSSITTGGSVERGRKGTRMNSLFCLNILILPLMLETLAISKYENWKGGKYGDAILRKAAPIFKHFLAAVNSLSSLLEPR